MNSNCVEQPYQDNQGFIQENLDRIKQEVTKGAQMDADQQHFGLHTAASPAQMTPTLAQTHHSPHVGSSATPPVGALSSTAIHSSASNKQFPDILK